MPRTARVVAVAAPHHVTQRGNNRQQVFFSDAQRRYYLSPLAVQSRLHELRILGYCLMPNHVHLVAAPDREDSLAKAVVRTNNAYSRYLNQVRKRSGHLWQNRFYSAPPERGHLLRALRYVDLNPMRAGLVERAPDFPWSSAWAHRFFGFSQVSPLARLPRPLDSVPGEIPAKWTCGRTAPQQAV